jgi:hypothetical protein
MAGNPESLNTPVAKVANLLGERTAESAGIPILESADMAVRAPAEDEVQKFDTQKHVSWNSHSILHPQWGDK